jgi:HEAT repeat protein
MKTALKWFAVLNSAAGLAIAQKQFFPFILFLVATLIITPPLRSAIERKMPIFQTRGTTGLAWICLYMLAWFLWSPIDPHIKHLEAQKNVGELIQIVQKQEGNANQAATALGNIGDKQAVAPLIKTIEDTSSSSSLREISVEALGKLRDTEAVLPLAQLLSSGGPEMTTSKAKSALKEIAANNRSAHEKILPDLMHKNSTKVSNAKQVLVAMGSPVVEDTLNLLKSADLVQKMMIMETLGEIGDAKAVKPLSEYLTDWTMKSDAGKALEKLNWQPETDRDRVRYWIALGRGTMLNEQWDTTKRVLMEDVKSSQRNLIDYALYAFITIGNQDVIPNLVDALHNQESKEMALAYLNCGQPTLEAAGNTWASDRGYEVIKTKDTSGRKVAWGALKN